MLLYLKQTIVLVKVLGYISTTYYFVFGGRICNIYDPILATYSSICSRWASVPSKEERIQYSYIFQIHFTLEAGYDYYVFFGLCT